MTPERMDTSAEWKLKNSHAKQSSAHIKMINEAVFWPENQKNELQHTSSGKGEHLCPLATGPAREDQVTPTQCEKGVKTASLALLSI